MKKRGFCLVLCICLAFALFGCGNKKTENNGEQKKKAQKLVIHTEKEDVSPKNKEGGAEEEQKESAKETEEAEIHAVENLDAIAAGTLIDPADIDGEHLEKYFKIYEIDDALFSRIYGLSYKADCIVPREDLRYIKTLYYGFDHQVYVGELMVNAALAEDYREIFQELYRNEYEIERMCLVDDYQADDNLSIENNNTSAFNYRVSTLDGVTLSNHAFGCAIDINPIQNPYVTYYDWGMDTYNAESIPYMYRDDPSLEHVIDHDDLCYRLFIEHGFTWGGDWDNPKDFQHFEKVL